MARAQIPDTSVLIQVFRDPDMWPSFQQSLASGRVWLSSVVVAELYAGTRSREDARLLDRIVGAMSRVERVLTPTGSDWARAGRLIARYTRLHGELKPRDHLADVLILVSAARLGGVVLTTNVRHFGMWADLAQKAGLTVGVERRFS
ncbi:MAG: type II toxin-antitoxin system VapC family toxin [Chloroflexota bacterium]|nr:MAG: type II toxin-antitoxin system VapC family toxin [Chloroflexota bacterium]